MWQLLVEPRGRPGADNMALDEALLQSAQRGQATLRFYGWDTATLSLGYFQPERVRHHDAQLAALPWVRRPSGGATLIHQHEVTYSLTLPPGEPWQTLVVARSPDRATPSDRRSPREAGSPEETFGQAPRHGQETVPQRDTIGSGCSCWLRRMHEIIAGALADLGVPTRMHTPEPDQVNPGFLCFRHFVAGDVLIGQAKVVGSAQRRQRGALLQHGAILLASSPWTPILPGILELTACRLSAEAVAKAVVRRFVPRTGWTLAPGDLTAEERQTVSDLTQNKYAADAWNRKR